VKVNQGVWILVVIQLLFAMALAIFGSVLLYHPIKHPDSSKKGGLFAFVGLVLIVLGAATGFGGDFTISLTSFKAQSQSLAKLLEAIEKSQSGTPDLPAIAATNPRG
jgi:hypothetical protein